MYVWQISIEKKNNGTHIQSLNENNYNNIFLVLWSGILFCLTKITNLSSNYFRYLGLWFCWYIMGTSVLFEETRYRGTCFPLCNGNFYNVQRGSISQTEGCLCLLWRNWGKFGPHTLVFDFTNVLEELEAEKAPLIFCSISLVCFCMRIVYYNKNHSGGGRMHYI